MRRGGCENWLIPGSWTLLVGGNSPLIPIRYFLSNTTTSNFTGWALYANCVVREGVLQRPVPLPRRFILLQTACFHLFRRVCHPHRGILDNLLFNSHGHFDFWLSARRFLLDMLPMRVAGKHWSPHNEPRVSPPPCSGLCSGN